MNRLAAVFATVSALLGATSVAAVAKPPPVDSCVPKALRAGAISFRTTDGVRISGVVLGSGNKGVVMAHELRGTLCNWLPFARTLARSGYRVLAFDSRNAGASAAAPYPKSIYLERDVLAAERELLRRGAKRVVLAGASAGGTAAMTAAPATGRVLAGVVVLSSPAQYVRMDAEAAARRVTAPSFFAVAKGDAGFVPEVQKLYKASASETKQLEILDGGDHGTAMLQGPAGAVLRPKLLAFLAEAFRE